MDELEELQKEKIGLTIRFKNEITTLKKEKLDLLEAVKYWKSQAEDGNKDVDQLRDSVGKFSQANKDLGREISFLNDQIEGHLTLEGHYKDRDEEQEQRINSLLKSLDEARDYQKYMDDLQVSMYISACDKNEKLFNENARLREYEEILHCKDNQDNDEQSLQGDIENMEDIATFATESIKILPGLHEYIEEDELELFNVQITALKMKIQRKLNNIDTESIR